MKKPEKPQDIIAILPDGTSLAHPNPPADSAMRHDVEGLPVVNRWLEAGVVRVRSSVPTPGSPQKRTEIYLQILEGRLTKAQLRTIGGIIRNANEVTVDINVITRGNSQYPSGTTRSLGGSPNSAMMQLRRLSEKPSVAPPPVTAEASLLTRIKKSLFQRQAPAHPDQSVPTLEFSNDPAVNVAFQNIMSRVSPEMDMAWRLWTSTDEDTMTDPKSLKRLQEFGELAIKDPRYQRELHQLIRDRLGTGPITVYHPISIGGSVLEGGTGFMLGTTSLSIAEFYAVSGRMEIETLLIQPDNIKAIGSLSQSQVIFLIPRESTPVS